MSRPVRNSDYALAKRLAETMNLNETVLVDVKESYNFRAYLYTQGRYNGKRFVTKTSGLPGGKIKVIMIEKLKTYKEYLQKQWIYELYIKAISKEGVPYKILQTVLPVIEHEVNVILSQIAEFSVRLETIDEKNIHAFIVYDEKRSWPVELTSGMERFILSLAFRQALCEITSLPRPNFMAIDEGFGVLDSENLQSVARLFNYLNGQYNYLLIISHIDSMRDMVDKQIRIDKIDGFSRLVEGQ